MFFEVAGWTSNLGSVWKPGWLVNNQPAPTGSAIWGSDAVWYFGLSNVATGAAGGGLAPPFPLFGGSGVSGFVLTTDLIPEPTELALLGLGVTCLLFFRGRK
jgi:hypothetical protein